MSGLLEFTYKIEGITPLILHNGELANPLSPLVKQFKEISGKRTKTDADYENMAKLEWIAGHYWSADGKAAVIPEKCLIACIKAGAKRFKRGVDVDRGVFISGDFPLVFDGPQDPEKRYQDKKYVSQVMMTIDRRRVLRTRPMFPEWNLTFSGSLDCQSMNKDDLTRFIEAAGLFAGLGDSRPRYGKFRLV